MAKCSFLIKDILRKKQDCGILKATSNASKLKHCFNLSYHENLTIPTNGEKCLHDGKSADGKVVVRHDSGVSAVIKKPLGRNETKRTNDKNIKWENYKEVHDNISNKTKSENQNRTAEERRDIVVEVTRDQNQKDSSESGKKAVDVCTAKSVSSVISGNGRLNDGNGKVTDKETLSPDSAKNDDNEDSQLKTGEIFKDSQQNTSQIPSLQHLVNSNVGHQIRGFSTGGVTLLHPRAVVPGIAGSVYAALPGIIASDPRVLPVPPAALPGSTGLQSPSLPRNKIIAQGKHISKSNHNNRLKILIKYYTAFPEIPQSSFSILNFKSNSVKC